MKNNQDTRALVPLPDRSLTNTMESVSRITSAMVGEALDLAKQDFQPRRVFSLLGGGGPGEGFTTISKVLLKGYLGSSYDIQVTFFETEDELNELVQTQRFDLIVLYLYGVTWSAGSLFDDIFNPSCENHCFVEPLARIRREYDIPIVAQQGLDLAYAFVGTGVAFLSPPWTVEDYRKALRALLKSPRTK